MFERMLIGKIENRILVGTLSFVGIMILFGWAAINEGGRMAAFTEMQEARAIELGASLFASQCTRCHGPDGRGLAGFAPGLNNPQFFGHDFFPEITAEINQLEAEKTALSRERGAPTTTDARKVEIDTRITEIDTRIETLRTERDPQLQVAIDQGYDPQRPSRLGNLGWVGTHESFVLTTLIHGRPTSGGYYRNGQAMPAWSQTAGGPLRDDQLEDLVAYIENWDKGESWTLEDLFAVKQFAIEPIDPAPFADLARPEPVGTDVSSVLAALADVTGDPARGDQLYHSTARSQRGVRLACNGCHLQTAVGTGPMADGTWTRIETERLQDPTLAGYAPEQYVVESILLPGNYIVPTFTDQMPKDFGQNITLQDLADLLAYLQTLTVTE